MRYEIRIGLGFLTHNKGQSIFIISAIALGVAVQVFISSLIISLQGSIIHRILGETAHIYIAEGKPRDKLLNLEVNPMNYGNFEITRNRIPEYREILENLKQFKEVTIAVPTLEENAIYKRQGKTAPISIRGIDLVNGDRLYNIIDRVVDGSSIIDSENVLIGVRLAKDYELKVGDIMPLTLSDGVLQKVRIAGIFDLENQGLNSNLMVMDLERAQRIFEKRGYVTHINIQIEDVFQATEVATTLRNLYPDLEVVPWTRDGENILKVLKSQTASSMTIQIVVMLATSMSIASVLLVTVIQKQKEIGILKAMGARDKSTGYIFLLQGAIIGFLGSLLGTLFGIILIKLYTLGVKPSFDIIVYPSKVLMILAISTLSGVVSGIFPARRCMKLNAIEVIRG